MSPPSLQGTEEAKKDDRGPQKGSSKGNFLHMTPEEKSILFITYNMFVFVLHASSPKIAHGCPRDPADFLGDLPCGWAERSLKTKA